MSSNASSIQIASKGSHRSVSSEESHKAASELCQSPEGGTTAWCTVIGGMLVMFCGLGYTTSFGVYQNFYTLHYLTAESSSAISWIGSINAFLVTGSGIVTGVLHDRGYFYYLLIGGSMLQSFSLFMLSISKPNQYHQIFLSQGIGLGIGQGIVYVPMMAVVSQHFRQRRTLAMSLVVCGASLGSMIHPIMLNYLFNWSGFADGVRISASFISILLCLACLLIRTRLEPPEHSSNYLSIGKNIIRDVPFCLMSLGLLCFQTAFFFPFFYLQLDSVKHKNPEKFSFYSLAILNGGSLIGRLFAGFFASRVGVPMLMIIATAACGILILGMIGLSDIPTVVVLGTIYGLFSGIYIALMAPIMTLLTSDLSELGARMGIGMLFTGIGLLLGTPISGALLTSKYIWWRPALFNGLVALAASLLLAMMQFALTQRQKARMKATEKPEV